MQKVKILAMIGTTIRNAAKIEAIIGYNAQNFTRDFDISYKTWADQLRCAMKIQTQQGGNRMKKTQRWLCLLLVLCLLLSVLPVTAMAVEPGVEADAVLHQEDAEAGADVLAAPQSVGEAGPAHGDLIYENDFSGEDPIQGWTNNLPFACKEGTLQGTTATSGGVILAGQPTGVANYVVSATTRILTEETSGKANDGHSAGIVFQASAENTFYHLRLDRSASNGDSLQLYRWNSSGAAQIKSMAFPWTTGDTYTLAAVIMGSTIQAYVNGVSIFRVTVETPLPAGRVGFRVYNCTAAFDDLKVWQLPAAQVEITAPEEPQAFQPEREPLPRA